MLRTDTWTYFEGFSDLEDGTTVMKFFGQVNKADPSNILITEKETEQDSYKKNVKQIRIDRRQFQDLVYAEADRISAELYAPPSSPLQDQVIDGDFSEVSDNESGELSDDSTPTEGGVFDEV